MAEDHGYRVMTRRPGGLWLTQMSAKTPEEAWRNAEAAGYLQYSEPLEVTVVQLVTVPRPTMWEVNHKYSGPWTHGGPAYQPVCRFISASGQAALEYADGSIGVCGPEERKDWEDISG